MLAAILEHRGARVVQSESPQAALAVLAGHVIDLVIADIAMPGIDGYELMRRIRDDGHRIPAIAVTAFARPDDRRRALECGYAGYLAKPVDARELAQTVQNLVAASTAS